MPIKGRTLLLICRYAYCQCERPRNGRVSRHAKQTTVFGSPRPSTVDHSAKLGAGAGAFLCKR